MSELVRGREERERASREKERAREIETQTQRRVPFRQPSQEKFFEQVELIVTKKRKIQIKLDQAWYSEHELRNDMNWPAHLR